MINNIKLQHDTAFKVGKGGCGFGQADKSVLLSDSLTLRQKGLYMYIASFADKDRHEAFPGRDLILNELSIGKQTYYADLKALGPFIETYQSRTQKGFAHTVFHLCCSGDGYVAAYRSFTRDAKISVESKGLFGILMAYADNRKTDSLLLSISDVAGKAGVSKRLCSKYLQELNNIGMIVITNRRADNGRFSSIQTIQIISHTPCTVLPHAAKRDTAKRDTVKRDTAKRDTVKRDTAKQDTNNPVKEKIKKPVVFINNPSTDSSAVKDLEMRKATEKTMFEGENRDTEELYFSVLSDINAKRTLSTEYLNPENERCLAAAVRVLSGRELFYSDEKDCSMMFDFAMDCLTSMLSDKYTVLNKDGSKISSFKVLDRVNDFLGMYTCSELEGCMLSLFEDCLSLFKKASQKSIISSPRKYFKRIFWENLCTAFVAESMLGNLDA